MNIIKILIIMFIILLVLNIVTLFVYHKDISISYIPKEIIRLR